jgi:hypothetical protein
LNQANGKLGENNCSSTLFFIGEIRQKEKFEIRKSSEFGVFQSPELRKKNDKSFQIFILGF